MPGLTLAAREWGEPGGLPVIALHGWLDNAGTFDLLAPRLEGTHLIALDCAGHGLSGHRSPDATYNVWQDVPEVFAVADLMGWERFRTARAFARSGNCESCGRYVSRAHRFADADRWWYPYPR